MSFRSSVTMLLVLVVFSALDPSAWLPAHAQSPPGAALTANSGGEALDAVLAEVRDALERDGSEATWPDVERLVGREDLPPAFRSQVLRAAISAARADQYSAYRESAERLFTAIRASLPAGAERSHLMHAWSNVEIDRGRFPEAEALLRQAINEADERSMEDRANLRNGLGVALAQQGRLDEALEAMLDAYARYEETDSGPSGILMANIGGLSIYLENWDQAIEFSRRAIETFGEDHPRTPNTYTNLAAALIERGDQDEARAALEQGIAIAERQGRTVASLRNNLGYLLREQGLHEDALAQFEASAAINRAQDDTGSLAISEKNIGETLIELGRRDEAAAALDGSLALYREADIKPMRLELYPVMVDNLEALGRYAEALALSREWRELGAELASADAQARVAELQTAFDLERSERELAEANQARLERDAELLALQGEQARQRLVRGTLIAGVVVLGLFLILVVRLLRVRTRANRLLAEKNAEIETQQRALAETNARLHRHSTEDELTGLANRRYVRALLDAELPPALQRASALLVLVDLDDFKGINDRYGHPVGDRVLARFADVLRDAAGPNDVLARWGGEEFLWLAAGRPMADAERVCRSLGEAVRSTAFDVDGETIRLTVSMGLAPVAFGEDPPADFGAAIKIADAALYEAKQAGRDGWVGFDRNAYEVEPFAGRLDIDGLIERGALVRVR